MHLFGSEHLDQYGYGRLLFSAEHVKYSVFLGNVWKVTYGFFFLIASSDF